MTLSALKINTIRYGPFIQQVVRKTGQLIFLKKKKKVHLNIYTIPYTKIKHKDKQNKGSAQKNLYDGIKTPKQEKLISQVKMKQSSLSSYQGNF